MTPNPSPNPQSGNPKSGNPSPNPKSQAGTNPAPLSPGNRTSAFTGNFSCLPLSLRRPQGYLYWMNISMNEYPYEHCYWRELHRIGMRSLKHKYQNTLSSVQCMAAFFCFVHFCVLFWAILHQFLSLQYIFITVLPMQQSQEPDQANSIPSHCIFLCLNAIISCSLLSSWYFCCIIFHLYLIVLLPFILQFFLSNDCVTSTIMYPGTLVHSMLPPKKISPKCNLHTDLW